MDEDYYEGDREEEALTFDDANGYEGDDECEDCGAEGVDVREFGGYKMVCRKCWDGCEHDHVASDYEDRMEERRQMGFGSF